MAEIISIIGSKGGSGKTTLSHMLCHGLGLIGRRAAYVMTDMSRQPPHQGSLPYVFADGRSDLTRDQIIAALRDRKDWIGILDGGASQMDTDCAIYETSDLVLLPFRDSQEDLRVVCNDLKRLPLAFAIPSQWPTNTWQYKASMRIIESLSKEFPGRVLAPVFSLSSSKLLLQNTPAERLPSALNSACKAVARTALSILEHEPLETTSVALADKPQRSQRSSHAHASAVSHHRA